MGDSLFFRWLARWNTFARITLPDFRDSQLIEPTPAGCVVDVVDGDLAQCQRAYAAPDRQPLLQLLRPAAALTTGVSRC